MDLKRTKTNKTYITVQDHDGADTTQDGVRRASYNILRSFQLPPSLTQVKPTGTASYDCTKKTWHVSTQNYLKQKCMLHAKGRLRLIAHVIRVCQCVIYDICFEKHVVDVNNTNS